MKLEELQQKVPYVLADVGRIMKRDVSGIEVKLEIYNGDSNSDSGIVFARNMRKKIYKEYNLFEKITHSLGLIRDKIYEKVIYKVDKPYLMKATEKNTILIFTSLNDKEEFDYYMIAHELAHLVDNKYTDTLNKSIEMLDEYTNAQLNFIRERHKEGIIKSYFKKSDKIKELEKACKLKLEKIENLYLVREGYINCVTSDYNKSILNGMGNSVSLKLLATKLSKALLVMPFSLLSGAIFKNIKLIKKQIKANGIAEIAYERGIDIKEIYNDIPTDEDLNDSLRYLARLVRKKYESKPQ